MKINRLTATTAAGALLVVPTAVLTASPASADVERTVRCGVGTGELSVDREGRRNEVAVDLDDVTPGSTWKVVLRKDGKRIAKVTRTADNEGDLEVERLVRNTPGKDRFTFRATQAGGGSCSAKVVA